MGGSAISRWRCALPPEFAGAWCRFEARSANSAAWWAKLSLFDAARGHVTREAFMGPCRPWRRGCRRTLLVHVPRHAGAATLEIYGDAEGFEGLDAARLPRLMAGLRLLAASRHDLAAMLAGASRGGGHPRAMLGQAAARQADTPPYARWITWFDDPQADRAALVSHPGLREAPDIIPCILAGSQNPQGLEATRNSLAAQRHVTAAPPVLINYPADWRQIAHLSPKSWVAVIAAGEILAPNALAHFALAARAHPDAAFLCADLDIQYPDGTRREPLFKPPPDRHLCRSGLPSLGMCLFRHGAANFDGLPAEAAAARWHLTLANADDGIRVPRILTHCPPSIALPRQPPPAPPTSPGALAVTAIVPSACRSRHVVRCLTRVDSGTDYPAFDIMVAASAIDPRDRRQRETRRRLRALHRVTIEEFPLQSFNFAAVVNRAAARAKAPYLLLLNDDVAPIEPDWLATMAAILRDDTVAAVGARLLYGNGTVQHEGVVMGLGGLCEHAGRLRRREDAGPWGIGRLTREVSAVTAACLLVRREAFLAVGGMDENFAIALNDADLCLRLRQAGGRIVYAGSVELYHFESLSLGRHYAGARAGHESGEVGRLRTRWADVIDADPCYNPQASLAMGHEWLPAFPPRDRETPLPPPVAT